MNYSINIPIEIFLTGIQFAALWLLFYKLYPQDSKVKRIMLLVFMAIWRPLYALAGPVILLPAAAQITLQAGMYSVLVVLAGGRKRNAIICAVYLWTINNLFDAISFCFIVGMSGTFPVSGGALYAVLGIMYAAGFLWALFYFSVMRGVPEEALNRIPLRFWFIVLLTPLTGAVIGYAAVNPLRVQLEVGFNNYLFFVFIEIILFILDLCIFYLFVKFTVSFNAHLLAGELSKTPPVYTPQKGLSAEFIEKYGLSKRQAEIAGALLQGKSNKEIAVLLDIEVNTVQVHLQNVYRKTGAPGRYAFMALAGLGEKMRIPPK